MKQSIGAVAHFNPGQILSLEHQGICLYAEVIQTVSDRNLCWVRPLALVTLATDTDTGSVGLHDLRQGVDLVCPQSLFQVALDTEVIPILSELNRLKPRTDSPGLGEPGLGENDGAREKLREFIRLVWQTNPKLFNPKFLNQSS